MKRSAFALGVTAALPALASVAATPPTHTMPHGLKYVDLKVGRGAMPKTGQNVTVTYVGTLANGTTFDKNLTGFSFVIGEGQVIPGWDEGVATMRVGGSRKLIIPPDLAYGATGAGGVIPPNATLVFVVGLLKIG